MPRSNNKQSKNSQKKQSGKQNQNSGPKSLLSQLLPHVLKALPALIGAIPFPVSGARAIASPEPSSVMQVSAPASNGAVIRTSAAAMRSSDKGMVVTHREYISDVVHSDPNVFELLKFEPVNPGNPNLFPWLSQIAPRFESYKFRRLRFIYEPQSSTQSVGTVMQVIDYDASDDPPVDKTQMMAYKRAVRSPAWFASVNESTIQDLNKRSTYYVRDGSQEGIQDPKLYDVGNYILAMQSESDPYTAGELYVEYTVDLMTPQLSQEGSGLSSTSSIDLVSGPTGQLLNYENILSSGNGPRFIQNDQTGVPPYLLFPEAGTFLLNFWANKNNPSEIFPDFDLVDPIGVSEIIKVNWTSNYNEVGATESPYTSIFVVKIQDPDTILDLEFNQDFATDATTNLQSAFASFQNGLLNPLTAVSLSRRVIADRAALRLRETRQFRSRINSKTVPSTSSRSDYSSHDLKK